MRAYDGTLTLDELLPNAQRQAILQLLSELAGAPLTLQPMEGQACVAHTEDQNSVQALYWDLEPIATLSAEVSDGDRPQNQLGNCAALIDVLMQANARYQMASALHLSAVQADYEALQQKHAELSASEAKYRTLSGELERRVQAQVGEIERTQRQLYQNEKLVSVGRLAAGVAHEINNPIGFVRSNLNTGMAYLSELSALRQSIQQPNQEGADEGEVETLLADFSELLSESIDGIDRVARIVSSLKLFSQVDQVDVRCVDFNDVVGSACAMAALQCPIDIELVFQPATLPAVELHAARMGEAILGLLQNARQAIDGAGRIEVTTSSCASWIELSITDTGSGIEASLLDRVFDPFFTTREVGAGTGLGLTVARDIARAHGGDIQIISTPGTGTKVCLRVPVMPDNATDKGDGGE